MKKLILPIIFIVFIFLLSPHVAYAGTDAECRPVFDQDMKKCTENFNACIHLCGEETKKPDGTAYFNSGEVYSRCTKREQCQEKSSVCNAKALEDFWACRKSDKKPEDSKLETSSPSQNEGQSWLEFLGINPYQTWLRLREVVEVSEFFASGDLEEFLEGGFLNLSGRKSILQKDKESVKAKKQAFESVFGKDWREQLNQPKIDSKTEENAWEIPVPKQESVTDVPGTTDTKRYSWDENSGVVVKSNDWEKIKFREPVEVEGVTSHVLEMGAGELEVKVRNSNLSKNKFGVDAGWLGVTVSRTHFRVFKDPDKDVAVVGVYEGEVEVKVRDGSTIKVKPDGDKPGVVVVSRKLSPLKLGILGLVVAGIVGGIIWFIKRKSSRKLLKKK
ncbi:hypothetical protein A3B45_05075 [Candidatus Daviesbacteria bacterium RIFCSPLOWO2_01_FULL_39_12]|uniref:FecR protein domain-containing protein n=1 Tax=Candidatus Daviesbacteria bacterium RIFCSPLOWO2_01_FULL_39_12 TaxID=1797785 RepID=A0A1F5KU71_9BACT|nr:MAG: hypothetical protein A3B45_05075 [Candidatus Daviesbacteria bacterium RIFCSPLOWO2_01_FULL_39_12]